MRKVLNNYSLKKHNTFGVEAIAKYFFTFTTKNEIIDFLREDLYSDYPILVLGGGSNILFTENFNGRIIYPNLKGIEIVEKNEKFVTIRVEAGETWDDFVDYTVSENLWGIENLSLIPGKVGAAPIQNIGAYGAEIKDVIEYIEGIYINDGKITRFSNQECLFRYRSSVFKEKYINKFIITSVVFKLNKQPNPITSYPDLKKELNSKKDININKIRKAIIDIRSRKLPDYLKTGNAGSFFKNPEINNEDANNFKKAFPEIPQFNISENTKKIPAAWLIEKCNWKGKIRGNAGVYKNHSLVLVNHNNRASGLEILDLAEQIQNSVRKKFGISLEFEVNIV